MRTGLMAALGALVLCVPAGWGEEKNAAEELAGLRQEVAELRREVARLNTLLAGESELGVRLLAISRKLAAGEQLAEGSADLAVLARALAYSDRSFGSEISLRALGLIRKLPPEQRGRLLGAALTDVSVSQMQRARLLDELAELGDAPARQAMARAAELEVQLPAVAPGHMVGNSNYFLSKLADKLVKAGDKMAVDIIVTCLDNQLQNVGRPERGTWITGEMASLAEKLGAWSGQDGWAELVRAHRERGTALRIKGEKDLEMARAEFAKVKAWWQDNREKFEFPKEEEKPPAPANPAGPAAPQPARPGAPETF